VDVGAPAARRRYTDALRSLAASDVVASLGGRTVGVIGCTGTIGAVLTDVLLDSGADGLRVVGVARRSTGAPEHPSFRFVAGSAADARLVDSLPPIDDVVYIAGPTRDYVDRRTEMVEAQLGLERFLARAAAGSRLVYVSSARVYGRRSRDEPLDEDATAEVRVMDLDNLYDSAKRLGESLCLAHVELRGGHAVAVRPTNLYGPPRPGYAELVVAELVRTAVESGEIRITGSPRSLRNVVSVADAVQGILRALVHARPGRAYNVGSDEHLTVLELAELVREHLPRRSEIVVADPSAEAWRHPVSIARARAELGYEPVHTLRGLAPWIVEETARAAAAR
jgi:UDP-glucuronate decarboxylase